MTAAEMYKYLHATGELAFGELTVRVEVKDARVQWGEVQLKVTPVAGRGEQWVKRYRVVLDEVSAFV